MNSMSLTFYLGEGGYWSRDIEHDKKLKVD